MRFSACLVALLLAAAPVQAQSLFKEYQYGASKASLLSMNGIYDCEDGFLCVDNQKFLGQPVTIGFQIVSDHLKSIVLNMENVPDPYSTVVFPLIKSGQWQLIPIQNPAAATSLDLISNAREGKTKEIAEFEQGAIAAGAITYTFLDLTDAVKRSLGHAANAGEVLRGQDPNLRALDIILSDTNDAYIVHFYLPLRAVTDATDTIEDF